MLGFQKKEERFFIGNGFFIVPVLLLAFLLGHSQVIG
jgi:hypothetical protein